MTTIDVENVREKLHNSRRRAAQYFATAAHSNDPATRAEALALAETWRSVAERTERLLQQLEDVTEPSLPNVFHSIKENDAFPSEPVMAG